ncbi:hypothetical protein B0H21DRAFT_58477 [Amylocystis lapponica]|nr:hypothetical protein B0H21DRAFT_58477 [Amylocystis lapponica]
MAAAKPKSAPTGAAKQPKPANGHGNGAASPVTPSEASAHSYGAGKPEKALYDSEQDQIKAEIDALQAKLVSAGMHSAVRDKISLSSKSGPGNDRRTALRAELDGIRGQQSNSKAARGKVFDQLKALQDGVQKRIKDLNAAKAKIPFKTVEEVDDHIRQLDKQIESGTLTLGDEKRAVAEINQIKRSRRAVEGFQTEQDNIDADRAKADELRRQLDDPEAKAASDRYEAIRAELDELKKDSDEAFANRNKLLDERTALQGQLDALYNRKRDSAQRFREANDRYWAKVNEDRARRAERQRAQRAADEDAKRAETVERLREEASVPAFQAKIEDCQTLMDYFSGKSSGQPSLSTAPLHTRADLSGVPKLELRKVENAPGEGLVARKKKGEDEEAYFGGTQRKGKKGAKRAAPAESHGAEAAANTLHVPLPTLSALLALSITPPTSTADVPRLVEDLKTKKLWFEANQARVTAENKEKAEAQIKKLTGKAESKLDVPSQSDDLIPPNGSGEHPAEPTPTPAAAPKASAAVSSDEVVEKLEDVQEHEPEVNGGEEE